MKLRDAIVSSAALVGLACGSGSGTSIPADEGVSTVPSQLVISDAGSIPFPIYELAFGQEPRSNWDGTLADLLAADALAMCTPSTRTTEDDANEADRYLAYLATRMDAAECGDPPAGPESTVSRPERWLYQRTNSANLLCNYRGVTGTAALLTLPTADADSSFFVTGGAPAGRWLAYAIDPVVSAPAGSDPVAAAVAREQAQAELVVAATNLCMANRLREQMHTLDILSATGSEQRQLLSVIRERAQIAMLQFALLGKAFSHGGAVGYAILDGHQYIPFLRKFYEQLATVADGQLARTLAVDFAASVRLHAEVTQELAELLGRSASARSDLGALGGSAFPESSNGVTFADVEWGPGGWRRRVLSLLYGGDPIGGLRWVGDVSDDNYDPATGDFRSSAPESANSTWGRFASTSTPLAGEQVLSDQLAPPEVQTLLGLLRSGDALYFARKPAPNAAYDVSVTASFLWAAAEAALRNDACRAADPEATCDVKADSSELPAESDYEEALLWAQFRITPAHGRALAEAIIQALPGAPGPPGSLPQYGAFHTTGPMTTVVLPPQRQSWTGPAWDHLPSDFAFQEKAVALRASVRAFLGGLYIPEEDLDPGHYASAQGFVARAAPPPGHEHELYKTVLNGATNDAMRYVGAASALAAVRHTLATNSGATNASEFYELSDEILQIIESAIGSSTVSIRPALGSVPAQTTELPCGEWHSAGNGGTCNVLAMGMPDADHVHVRVELLRPVDAGPVHLLLVGEEQVSAISGANASDLRFITNIAQDETFVSPNGVLGRPQLNSIPAIAPYQVSTSLGVRRERFLVTHKHGSLFSPILLAVPATGARQYSVLSDGYIPPTFQWGETRVTPGLPLLRSASGYYFGPGGAFGAFAQRVMQRHPTQWNRSLFDGFGYPIDWTPPTSPDLLGGATDPIAYYLAGAKEAAGEATAAVTGALDAVIQEAADSQRLEASRQRAAGLTDLERKALCGDGPCDTTYADWSPPPLTETIQCPEASGVCRNLQQTLALVVPEKISLLVAVQSQLGLASAPAFDEFHGGILQSLALDQWKAAKQLDRSIWEIGPRLEKLTHAAERARIDAETAKAQFDAQQTADDQQDASLRSEWVHLCFNRQLEMRAWVSQFNFKAGTIGRTDRRGGDAWIDSELANPIIEEGKITGWSPQPVWNYEENCRRAQKAYFDAKEAVKAHDVESFRGAVETESAAKAEILEASTGIVSSIIVSLADIQKARVAVDQAAAGLDRSTAKIALDSVVEASGVSSQLAVTRRYHHPDMWRARALLENARRLSVTARRAIESRYNVDMTALHEDEPFVAAPALWADQVYEYDLNPPNAVGLARSSASLDGIYTNQLLDYVRNLENFVRGYPVHRPTAGVASDTEVITLPGPGALDEREPGDANASPDAARWAFQCEGASDWVSNPRNEPAGEAMLRWTFEGTQPFLNHGYGEPVDMSTAGAIGGIPAIDGYAVDLTNAVSGTLYSAPTEVGESSSGITLSSWVNLRTHSGNTKVVCKNYYTTGFSSPYAPACLTIGTSRQLRADVAINPTTYRNVDSLASGYLVPVKDWVHVAMTYDSRFLRIYANGQLVGTRDAGAVPEPIDWGQHGRWMIGGVYDTSTQHLDGYVGTTRVHPFAMGAADIQKDYEQAVPGTGPMARWEFSEAQAPYQSTGAVDWLNLAVPTDVPGGAPFPSSMPPFDAALDFTGGTCLSSFATNGPRTPSEITLSAWVYPRTLLPDAVQILGKTYSSSTWQDPWVSALIGTRDGGKASGAVAIAGVPWSVTDDVPLPTNTWSHLAMTFDGATISLFVNGALVGDVTTGPPAHIDWGPSGGGPWIVGGRCLTGLHGEFFDGYIARPRIDAVARPSGFLATEYGRGRSGECFYDNECTEHQDCCPDWVYSPLDDLCDGLPPSRARIQFHLDPWGREAGYFANPPFTARHNVRWGRLAVNLVGTGVRDCTRAADSLACYAESFLRFDLSHAGPAWTTDFAEQWHSRPLPIGQIEGGKALATEEWLDPVANSWNQPFVGNVARAELVKRPVGGLYTLDIALGPDVRADRIRRVQVLAESEYWVRQR